MPDNAQRGEVIVEGDLKAKSAAILADIDSVIDQTLQIFELNSKEGEIIESIGSSISILLTTLKLSLSLSQNIFQNDRSEEHTSELQSRFDLVCRLLLEK